MNLVLRVSTVLSPENEEGVGEEGVVATVAISPDIECSIIVELCDEKLELQDARTTGM